jgi:hypothetical protein
MASNTQQLIVTLLQNGKSSCQVIAQLLVSYSIVQILCPQSKAACPRTLVGAQGSSKPVTNNPLPEKSPLEQLILPPNL